MAENSPFTRERRRRVGELHAALPEEREAPKEHAQWWGPEMRTHWGATRAPSLGGADAAIPAWTADQPYKDLRWKLSAAGGDMHGNLVHTAKGRKLAECKKFKAAKPVTGAHRKRLLRTRDGRLRGRRWKARGP